MSRRVRQAALRIMTLLEEFAPEELAEALSLIGEGPEQDLLAFLRRIASAPPRPSRPRVARSEALSSGETRALQKVKHTDGEKYRVLSEFEGRIRGGAILTTLEDLRAFGDSLTKHFAPGKSRKEALERVMALLATMDLGAIREAIARVPPGRGGGEGAYRRLANHIISGGHQQPSGQEGGTAGPQSKDSGPPGMKQQ
jgi:hypothetical protein